MQSFQTRRVPSPDTTSQLCGAYPPPTYLCHLSQSQTAWLPEPRPVSRSEAPSPITARDAVAGRVFQCLCAVGTASPRGWVWRTGRGPGVLWACYSGAIAWSENHMSLPDRPQLLSVLELVGPPGLVQPHSHQACLPGKAEGRISGFPSHKDVIPRGLSLTVGNLAQPGPSAQVVGSQVQARVAGKASQLPQHRPLFFT